MVCINFLLNMFMDNIISESSYFLSDALFYIIIMWCLNFNRFILLKRISHLTSEKFHIINIIVI